jgi:hypothetical protein
MELYLSSPSMPSWGCAELHRVKNKLLRIILGSSSSMAPQFLKNLGHHTYLSLREVS